MSTHTQLVVMADEDWTTQALLLAFAMARQEGGDVVLLRMIPAQHALHLGRGLGDWRKPVDDGDALQRFAHMAQDYVNLRLVDFQYVSRIDAICDAAEQLDARVVMAKLPESRLHYIDELRRWWPKAQLGRSGRTLVVPNGTLQLEPVQVTPSVQHAHRH